MRNKLRDYIIQRFAGAPDTPQVRELREEILQNTFERYDDLIADGMSEAAAYSIAVEGVGDIDALLASFHAPAAQSEKKTQRRPFIAVAIALYILCVVPTILLENVGQWGEPVGVSLMFLMIAVATALIIIGSGRKSAQNTQQTYPTQEAQQRKSTGWKIFDSIYWCCILAIFFLAGFRGYWYCAWLVFPLGGALQSLIEAVVRLMQGHNTAEKLCSALMWLAVTGGYIVLTARTGQWSITWLMFPIGAALEGVISGIFTLVKGGKS